MRTLDVDSSIFQPLEDIIQMQFIPALTGHMPTSPEVRGLLSLPARLGGMNISNPTEIVDHQRRASEAITAPLKKMIVERSKEFTKP